MGDMAMDPRQVQPGLLAIPRAFLLAGERPVGLCQGLETLLEGLRSVGLLPSLPVSTSSAQSQSLRFYLSDSGRGLGATIQEKYTYSSPRVSV